MALLTRAHTSATAILVLLATSQTGCGQGRTAETVAQEIARRYVCEAYTGAPTNSVACDWPDLPLAAHLAMVTPTRRQTVQDAQKTYLTGAIMRLEASLKLPDYWKTELPLRAAEDEASIETGLRALLQEEQARILTIVKNRADETATFSKQLKDLPEFSRLTGLVQQVTEGILKELKLQPQVLTRYKSRSPSAPDLVKVRNIFKVKVTR